MGNGIVSARMKQRREALGLTLDEIALEIGLAKSTIQRYENGKIQRLKLPVIEAIANVLSVDPSWLIGKSENPEIVSNSLIVHSSLSPDEAQLLEDYRDASEEIRDSALEMLHRSAERNRKESARNRSSAG